VARSDAPAAVYDPHTGVLTLRLHVTPGAQQSSIDGRHGDRLKIRIAAKPVDGEANAALCLFIADAFGVAKRSVTIVAGHTGRSKTVHVERPARRPDREWLDRG